MSAHRLYFAQHGLAVSKSDNPERPLSDLGIEQTTIIAKQILHANLPVNHIFHSGKLRALQTAEIFASILNATSVSAIDYLSPNDDVALIAQNLNINNALYIGHLPQLEKLVSYLVTGKADQKIIKFQNSAVVCLEKNEDQYQILWYFTPYLSIH
jgi:phosphohistidine phosphatase